MCVVPGLPGEIMPGKKRFSSSGARDFGRSWEAAAIELAACLRYTSTRPLAGGGAAPGAFRPAIAKNTLRGSKGVLAQGFTDVLDIRHGSQDHFRDLRYSA